MKKLLTIIGLTLALALPFGATAFAADPFREVCRQGGASRSEVCRQDGTNPISGDQGVLPRVVNGIALIAGAIAVIFIIIAGIQYVTAAGDSNQLTQARNTILYALAGVVLIVIARSIIVFVINRL